MRLEKGIVFVLIRLECCLQKTKMSYHFFFQSVETGSSDQNVKTSATVKMVYLVIRQLGNVQVVPVNQDGSRQPVVNVSLCIMFKLLCVSHATHELCLQFQC